MPTTRIRRARFTNFDNAMIRSGSKVVCRECKFRKSISTPCRIRSAGARFSLDAARKAAYGVILVMKCDLKSATNSANFRYPSA